MAPHAVMEQGSPTDSGMFGREGRTGKGHGRKRKRLGHVRGSDGRSGTQCGQPVPFYCS